LVLHRGVEGVEEEDVDRGAGRNGCVVSEDAGRKARHYRRIYRRRKSDVLFEGDDLLRGAVFGDGEVGHLEVVDGLLFRVGDEDVDDDELGIRFEG
jgi:hypothetical protein